jgi:glycosyltransferase involved in cell wall biosynthesis
VWNWCTGARRAGERDAALRILLVFPFLPYPPDDGGRIGFFNPIKYLSRKHEVSVVCLTEGRGQEESIEELKRFCVEVRTHQRSSWQDPYRLLKGAVLWPPGSGAKYWHRGMGELIREMVAEQQPEIVEFNHLNTAIYRDFAGSVPTVLREHNVEYKVWEQFANHARGWTERTYARWSVSRVRRYEANMCARFDRCVVVSPSDAAHLRGIAPQARIEVIPSGVDTEYFYPTPDVPEEPLSVTLTGSFEWRPRQQSLFILLTKVFPKLRAQVPRAKLYVVGKGVPEYLQRVAREVLGVTIVGPVPDVRPYIARSSLMINYLESGGGIALKVLEAMAMRKPVLCNSLGCEGIPITHGRDIFVADGPEGFASAAAYLLENESVRTEIAENGYLVASEKYSWKNLASEFTSCYNKILEKHEGGRGFVQAGVGKLS